MKIKEIVNALEQFAPLPLQDGFDNAGMQVGLTEVEATGALLCLDVTETVLDEAIALGYNLIITHHPLIFKGYKSITGKDYVERCIIKALKNDITIYAAHTNLDNARGGVNYKIAEKLGLKNIHILDSKKDELLKLVTFAPDNYLVQVREALFNVGCGNIGNYDCCSYNVIGEGTFKAKPGTTPFCGTIGELHTEKEIRIETILPGFKMNDVKRALIEAHPYEEPAFDFYPIKNYWDQVGSGVIGELEKEESELDFLHRLKETFQCNFIRHSKLREKTIRKVSLCGGSGAFLLPKACTQKADIFITGEIRYHDYFSFEDSILMAEIGHYESEQYTKELFATILQQFAENIPVRISKINTNPIKYL